MKKPKPNLKEQLRRLNRDQQEALARALREMLDQGVKLTRDRLREWSGVDNNAASAALRGYREGLFSPAEPAPDPAPMAVAQRKPWWELSDEAIELVEEMHGLKVGSIDGYSDMTIAETFVLGNILGGLMSPRRRAALIRFAALLDEDEQGLRDALDDIEFSESETWLEDMNAWLEERGLCMDGQRDHLPADDPGLAAIRAMTLDDIAAWSEACADGLLGSAISPDSAQ